MKLRMISMQWQARSTMAPPPASVLSQNQALCGPEWVSRDRTQRILPSAPRLTAAMDFRVLGVSRQRLGAEDGLADAGRELDRLFVEIVGDTDDHDVGLGILDRLLHVRRPFRDSPLPGERLGFAVGQGADRSDAVPASLSLDRHRIKRPDEPGPEQGDGMRFFHVPPLMNDVHALHSR